MNEFSNLPPFIRVSGNHTVRDCPRLQPVPAAATNIPRNQVRTI